MRVTIKALVSLPLVVALALPATPARAQNDEEEPNAVRMGLNDCLTKALENNLDLRLAKLDPQSTLENVTFQDAAFDAVLGADATYGESKSDFTATRFGIELDPDGDPVAVTTVSDDSDDNSFTVLGASLSQLLTFGASYIVRLEGNDSDSSGSSFNPPNFFTLGTSARRDLALTATFNLPLLKGLGREVTTLSLVLAENDSRISEEELRRRAELTIKAVGDAYWDVTAARAAVRVAKQSLKLAQDLFDLNKKKVEVGTLAPIEITQAEAGVASRQEGVIVAENLLRNTEDNLRRFMAVPPQDPLWGSPIITSDQPASEPVSPNLDEAIATALQTRAEVRNARIGLESSALASRVAEKEKRHQLDLQARIGASRGNSSNDTFAGDPPGVIASTDLDPIKGGPDWSVGLVYAYPIGNRAAKANAAIAKINEERAQIGVESAEQDVRVDVRTAVRAVQSGAQRVQAAHANTALQQKTVDAELKKFENGMSTSFEVLRIQTDLSDAQVAEIRAVLDYNKALADLERAKGTLLTSKGMKLETNRGN